jgi:hypothetical protein
MANYVMVSRAERESKYSARHIRYLVQNELVAGYKEGWYWFVDLEDLQRYERKMDELGSQKFDPTRGKEEPETSSDST